MARFGFTIRTKKKSTLYNEPKGRVLGHFFFVLSQIRPVLDKTLKLFFFYVPFLSNNIFINLFLKNGIRKGPEYSRSFSKPCEIYTVTNFERTIE